MKTKEERYDCYLSQDPFKCFESPMESKVYFAFREIYLLPILQYPEDPYFIDFSFPQEKIAIEYDGQEFHQDKLKDTRRDNFLISKGWDIYRISFENKWWKLDNNGESLFKKFDDLMEYLGNIVKRKRFGDDYIERMEKMKREEEE